MPLREHVADVVTPGQRVELLAAAAAGRLTHSKAGVMMRFAQPRVTARRCDRAVRVLVGEGLLEMRPDGTVRPAALPQRRPTVAAEVLYEGPNVETLLRIREGLAKL